MSIHEITPAYEAAHYAILDEMPRAKREHPEPLTIKERIDAVICEAVEAMEAHEEGNHDHTMTELKHVGTTLYRAMEEVQRMTGVIIR